MANYFKSLENKNLFVTHTYAHKFSVDQKSLLLHYHVNIQLQVRLSVQVSTKILAFRKLGKRLYITITIGIVFISKVHNNIYYTTFVLL